MKSTQLTYCDSGTLNPTLKHSIPVCAVLVSQNPGGYVTPGMHGPSDHNPSDVQTPLIQTPRDRQNSDMQFLCHTSLSIPSCINSLAEFMLVQSYLRIFFFLHTAPSHLKIPLN